MNKNRCRRLILSFFCIPFTSIPFQINGFYDELVFHLYEEMFLFLLDTAWVTVRLMVTNITDQNLTLEIQRAQVSQDFKDIKLESSIVSR